MLSYWLETLLNNATSFTPKSEILVNGTQVNYLDLGVIEIIPPDAKHAIVVSSGIHGNETAPIELVDNIAKSIAKDHFQLSTRVLLIIAHQKAILNNTRMIEKNLNRLFGEDNKEINSESILANNLQNQVHSFFQSVPKNEMRWHFDLHCAIRPSRYSYFALIPACTNFKEVTPLVHFFIEAKIQAQLFNQTPSSTFSWWTGEYLDALSATVELGQVKPLFENDLSLLDSVEKALVTLMTEHDKLLIKFKQEAINKAQIVSYRVSRSITKLTEEFDFTFKSTLANFTWFEEGALIAYEGCGYQYLIDKGGEAVIFPNKDVEIGQRACLLIKPIHLDDSLPVIIPLFQNN